MCGRGTYVRSIVRDIGWRLGCGAFVKSLRRISIGDFKVEDALSFNDIKDAGDIKIIN